MYSFKKILKKRYLDVEMNSFFKEFVKRNNESLMLYLGGCKFLNNKMIDRNYSDEQLENILLDIAEEKKWLKEDYSDRVTDIYKGYEIIKNYHKESKIYLKKAAEIKKELDDVYEEIIKIGFFGYVNEELSEKLKQIYIKKSEIVDRLIDCVLYKCILRFSFKGMSSMEFYNVIEEEKGKIPEEEKLFVKMTDMIYDKLDENILLLLSENSIIKK